MASDNGLEFLQTRNFIDTRPAAERFKICLRMKALSTCIAVLILSYILSTMLTKRYSISILESAVRKNSQYLILILPIFVGLSIIGGLILGPYNPDYAYFHKAIISVALFTIGRICKFGN